MLPKQHKLRLDQSFKTIYKTGRFIASANFKLNFDLQANEQGPYFAVVITKKFGPATSRNALRRIVYTAIAADAAIMSNLKLQAIVAPKKDFNYADLKASTAAIQAEVISILQKTTL